MDKLLLEIVTPERKVLSKEVDEVTLPGAEGELGILPGHTELLTLLRPGRLVFKAGNETGVYALAGGFAEVGHTKVVILGDAAEAAKEIDVTRAKTAKERAEKALSELEMSDENWAGANAALERAVVRIDIAATLSGR
jgi:F-type H+-transporting ATPase subunit epsilon